MSALKEALRADIFSYESALSTTPFLSKIYHAEVALLALLEETNHGKPADAPRYPNLAAVKEANLRRGHETGLAYWFGESEIAHFGTRFLGTLHAGKYFVTSEYKNFGRKERAFSIREAMPDGSIDTVGAGFLGYATRSEAEIALLALTETERLERERGK